MNGAASSVLRLAMALVVLLIVFVGGGLGSCAAYNTVRVWNAQKEGEAELARATQNRRIKVLEAQARMDSASLEAQAEVARARGLAEANRIVADSLGGPEGYLRYLYIQNLENPQGQIIYVPTEGGLPILEASRLNSLRPPQREEAP